MHHPNFLMGFTHGQFCAIRSAQINEATIKRFEMSYVLRNIGKTFMKHQTMIRR
jgi:hypothetical protein